MSSAAVVWIDEHPCTANAVLLIDRLLKLGRLGGANPIKVNAPMLAALTGETIGVVLSDDESLLGQNK